MNKMILEHFIPNLFNGQTPEPLVNYRFSVLA